MKERIDALDQLEEKSRRLDCQPDEFRRWMRRLEARGREFLGELPSGPAFYPLGRPADIVDPPNRGVSLDQALDDYWRKAVRRGINPASGRFFGYIPGGGVPAAAVGDFVAALTNRYSGAFGASPGAAEIENTCVEWLRRWTGMPTSAWGTLQSGGSLATLTAIVVARARLTPEQWGKAVFYTTAEVHHCFEKALLFAGLAQAQQSIVRTDSEYRMDPEALAEAIDRDRDQGKIPWLVCANAGTTNTGAVDPLRAIGEVCRHEKLWFHVDGAYGGLFCLSETGKPLLEGMEDADSLVVDPHKSLFLPYGCGAVLIRDREKAREAMAFHPSYMQDIEGLDGLSPSDFSPELTRHFRGMRFWLPIRMHGLDCFRAALEEKLILAQYLHHELSIVSGIEVGPEPQLTVVTFRARGDDEMADQATRLLLDTLLERGIIHVSSTRLHDRMFIRLCVLCFRTHQAEVETALEEIRGAL